MKYLEINFAIVVNWKTNCFIVIYCFYVVVIIIIIRFKLKYEALINFTIAFNYKFYF